MGEWWGTGDPGLGDITRDGGRVSGGEPFMPGYMTGMPPGYQHFSSMGRYAAAAAAVGGMR